jgi:hypothetical protein
MTVVLEGHQPPAPLVKAFNVVLRAVLPTPLGRGIGEFMLLAFPGRLAAVVRTYLGRMTELGLRRAARQIGLRFPAGRLPTSAGVGDLVRREHFGVVRLSGKT